MALTTVEVTAVSRNSGTRRIWETRKVTSKAQIKYRRTLEDPPGN
jgi:hypothetical protein